MGTRNLVTDRTGGVRCRFRPPWELGPAREFRNYYRAIHTLGKKVVLYSWNKHHVESP